MVHFTAAYGVTDVPRENVTMGRPSKNPRLKDLDAREIGQEIEAKVRAHLRQILPFDPLPEASQSMEALNKNLQTLTLYAQKGRSATEWTRDRTAMDTIEEVSRVLSATVKDAEPFAERVEQERDVEGAGDQNDEENDDDDEDERSDDIRDAFRKARKAAAGIHGAIHRAMDRFEEALDERLEDAFDDEEEDADEDDDDYLEFDPTTRLGVVLLAAQARFLISNKESISVREAAALASLDEKTVYRLARDGEVRIRGIEDRDGTIKHAEAKRWLTRRGVVGL